MNKIERAHQMYRDAKYEEALEFYTDALSIAKTKLHKIALHSNRAACFLKLHHFKQAAEECTSVLELDNNHTGALMLRAQTLVTLKEYSSALFDVNRLIEMNPSSEVYQSLHARLKTQLALATIPEAEAELEEDDDDDDEEQEEDDEVKDAEGDEGEVGGREKDQEADNKSVLVGENQDDKSGGLKSVVTPNTEVNSTPKNLDHGQNSPRSTTPLETQSLKKSPEEWKAIPKPKGHSRLDYSRWDKVENDSSDEEDSEDEEESKPQYRFRVRTVGVRPVK